MLTLCIVFAFLALFYLLFYVIAVKNDEIYTDICEPFVKVKVIKRGIFMTTIAHLNKEPERILTFEFMLRYTPEINRNI